MKILFWTDGFWPRFGGMETQSIQFVNGMQKRGHQYIVVAHKDFENWKEEDNYNGILIKRFDFNMIQKRDLKILRQIQNYLEWINNHFRPDIVHLNGCVGWSPWSFLLFKTMLRLPVILTVHAPFYYQNETNPLIEKIANFATEICCVSNWVVTEMEKLVPTVKNKLRLIYNGLPTPETVPTPLAFSPPKLLIIGRFTEEKGFDTAIRAFFLLKKKQNNTLLIIAGDGANQTLLKHLVAELGLTKCVQFTGSKTRDEIFVLINQATIVVVPSYFETFGLVALEAMQMRRPVIASRVGGLQELIVDKETGLLVPPHDPLVLSQAIEDLLSQPDKAIEMGINGYNRSLKFSLDQHVEKYESLQKKLIKKT